MAPTTQQPAAAAATPTVSYDGDGDGLAGADSAAIFGNITRQRAAAILHRRQDGNFLVRTKTRGLKYAVSVVHGRTVEHYLLSRSSEAECFSLLNEARRRVVPLPGCATVGACAKLLMTSRLVGRALCDRPGLFATRVVVANPGARRRPAAAAPAPAEWLVHDDHTRHTEAAASDSDSGSGSGSGAGSSGSGSEAEYAYSDSDDCRCGDANSMAVYAVVRMRKIAHGKRDR